jgi:general secretion pathway protein G
VLFVVNGKGFTLIEVMVVAAIIGTLAALALPSYMAFRHQARISAVISDLKHIEKRVIGYMAENGCFPDTLAEVGLDGLRDAWGNPYDYWPILGDEKGKYANKVRKYHGIHPINTDFDLYSLGTDGQTNSSLTAGASRDDIIRASNGAYFGLAESY